MMLLVSGSTRSVRELASQWPDHLGHLLTPKNRNSVDSILATGLSWAVDNGAFSGFDPESFRRLLGRVRGKPRLLWIACPDVVADCNATLDRFNEWQSEVARAGPVAFVGQDGAEAQDLPWKEFSCLFVGGSTEWKLSNAAFDLTREARRRGKWVHMGRVNSRVRLRWAWSMGANSIDGGSMSMFGDIYIPLFLKWQAEMIAWN